LNAGAPNTNDGSIIWGNWYHVAITNDGETARTYINGNLVTKGDVGGNLEVDNTPLIVGRNLDESAGQFYKGCMAHIRLYDDALTVDEIRRDMMHDESAASAFVRSHPIGFELYNEDNHHVLYIDDDPAGQALWLDIVNTSNRNIELNDLGQTATPQNHHFELRFRPETLASANSDQIKVVTDGWSLDRRHQQGQAGGDSLYLLYKGSKTLKVAEKTTLKLTGLNADGGGGTRGTRVELISKNTHLSGETALLEDTRLQFLDIVNHRGRRNIPLHVGFVGSDTVLSDGNTPNTLKLRIANVSRDVGLRLSKGSRFRISFDVQQDGETREWALTDYTKVKSGSSDSTEKKVDGDSLSVVTHQTQGVNSNWAKPKYSNLGQTVEWTIAPNEDTTLEANGYIILELGNLVVPASIGHANIYFNFEDIPGYENEQKTIVVQKSPLLYSNYGVGIGTATPGNYKLNVEGGDTRLGGALTMQTNAITEGENNYHLEVYSPDTGDFSKYTKIRFHQSNQYWSWLGYHGTSQNNTGEFVFWNLNQGREAKVRLGDLDVNGTLKINAATPGNYILNVEGGDTRLGKSLHIEGNVGIGTITPMEKLEVNGRIKDKTGYIMPVGTIVAFAGSSVPAGWLMCDGKAIPYGDEYNDLKDCLFHQRNRSRGKFPGIYYTPNLSGRTLIGAGGYYSGTTYSLDQTGGEETHQLTVAEMPAHAHNYHKPKHNYGHRNGGEDWSRYGHENQQDEDLTTTIGGNSSHNNMQPYYVVNYIIKY